MIQRLFIFAKAQASSFTGGLVDYLFMILFTEFFNVRYTISIAIGGVIGAFVNFYINKGWAFRSKEIPYKHTGWKQLLRFGVVVINSILLKVSGTYFFTTFLKTDYIISRLITDLIVSIGFNYMLQRHWVFRKENIISKQYASKE